MNKGRAFSNMCPIPSGIQVFSANSETEIDSYCFILLSKTPMTPVCQIHWLTLTFLQSSAAFDRIHHFCKHWESTPLCFFSFLISQVSDRSFLSISWFSLGQTLYNGSPNLFAILNSKSTEARISCNFAAKTCFVTTLILIAVRLFLVFMKVRLL